MLKVDCGLQRLVEKLRFMPYALIVFLIIVLRCTGRTYTMCIIQQDCYDAELKLIFYSILLFSACACHEKSSLTDVAPF